MSKLVLELPINLGARKKPFYSLEEEHLNLLLFLLRVKNLFLSASFYLEEYDRKSKKTLDELKKVYFDLPKELLKRVGYRQNLIDYEKIRYNILLMEELYDIAMQTQVKDLCNIDELSFLKVNEFDTVELETICEEKRKVF